MKKIIVLCIMLISTSMHSSDNIAENVPDNTTQATIIRHKPIGIDKRCELYLLYQKAESPINRQQTIIDIKKYHEKHSINYNDNYCINIDGSPPHNLTNGRTPLAFALRCDTDFAFFLLNDIKVDVKPKNSFFNSSIHYLMYSIISKGFTSEHKNLLKTLLEKKADINGIHVTLLRPLEEYVIRSDNYDPFLFREFFNHGAFIFRKNQIFSSTVHTKNNDNLLTVVLNTKKTPENICLSVETIYRERLYTTKQQYQKLLCWLTLINKTLPKLYSYLKLPKPIMHVIVNIALKNDAALLEIKEAIGIKNFTIAKKRKANAEPPSIIAFEGVSNSQELLKNERLAALFSSNYWNRSLTTIFQDLSEKKKK